MKRDITTTLRTQAQMYRQMKNPAQGDILERAAEEIKTLRELREAVAWERECCQDIRPLVAWAGLYVLHGEDYVDAVAEALREIQDAARAEVDRMLGERVE